MINPTGDLSYRQKIVWGEWVFEAEPIDIQRWACSYALNFQAPSIMSVNMLTVPRDRVFLCKKIGFLIPQMRCPSDAIWFLQGRPLNAVAGTPIECGFKVELFVNGSKDTQFVMSPLSWLCGVPWVDYEKMFTEGTNLQFQVTNQFEGETVGTMDFQHHGVSGDIIFEARLTGLMMQKRGLAWPSTISPGDGRATP